MARGIKIEQWETAEKLAELKALSKHTLTEIAAHIGIHRTTLDAWCKKSPAIREALTQYDKQRAIEVEHAMYDACFDRRVKMTIKKQALDRDGNVHDLTETKEVVVPADVRAQKYWLNNRNPERWSEKPENRDEDGTEVISFIPVSDRMTPPEEEGEDG